MPALRHLPDNQIYSARAFALVWRYGAHGQSRTAIRREFATVQTPDSDPSDHLPFINIKESFSQWNNGEPIIHDCRVEVTIGPPRRRVKTETFLISAYYNAETHGPNIAIQREFPRIADWYGELAVVPLGKRKTFRKNAQMSRIRKAVAAFISQATYSLELELPVPEEILV